MGRRAQRMDIILHGAPLGNLVGGSSTRLCEGFGDGHLSPYRLC